MNKSLSGFKASGIVPFNPDKFSADDFALEGKYKELIVEADTKNESVHSTLCSCLSSSVALVQGSADSLNAGPSNVHVVHIAPIPKRNFLDKEEKACSRTFANRSDSECSGWDYAGECSRDGRLKKERDLNKKEC